MASYYIFTYQFQRITKGATGLFEFTDMPSIECSDEDWANRQSLFGSLFKGKDFEENEIEYRRADSIYVHKVLYDRNNIIVMKFSNPKRRKISNVQLNDWEIDDFPWCYVIWDNRDGIQRLFIERKATAWPNTKSKTGAHKVAELLRDNIDRWMVQKGMHFDIGDGPTYPRSTFWDIIEQHPEGFSKINFSFPPLNLGRLLNLADNVDAIRYETGGGYDASLKAPKDGVLSLSKDNPQTSSLVNLSSAGGYEVKAFTRGGHSFIRISGADETNPVMVEIPAEMLSLLSVPDLFKKDQLENLIAILNSVKNSYE